MMSEWDGRPHVGTDREFTVCVMTNSSTTVTSGSFSSQATEFDHFLEYYYDESYLTPSDSWSFSLPADELGPNDLAAIKPAARVEVRIDGNVQSIGYIDDIRSHGSRTAGSTLTISGRESRVAAQ